MWKRTVLYEQAVYGNFPFWSRGYGLLAHSAKCEPDWLAALKLACQRFGERPRECADNLGFFAIPQPDGPCMIVGVFPNGRDDQGRPGALVFHALFIPPRAYRKAGYDPFPFVEGLRCDWSSEEIDTVLPTGTINVSCEPLCDKQPDRLVEEIARAINGQKKVIVPSLTPIDPLARSVWNLLPVRVRKRASMATFAYDNGNRFDLVALPGRRSAELAVSRDPACVMIDAHDYPDSRSSPDHEKGKPTKPGDLNDDPPRSPRLFRRFLRSITPLLLAISFQNA